MGLLALLLITDDDAFISEFSIRVQYEYIAFLLSTLNFKINTMWHLYTCLGTRGTRVASALSKAQLQDGYVAYPWEKKMRDTMRMPNSTCYLSILILPKSLDSNACRYESFDDTLARANAWLSSSQASGIPVVFMTVQSEALLTKVQIKAL